VVMSASPASSSSSNTGRDKNSPTKDIKILPRPAQSEESSRNSSSSSQETVVPAVSKIASIDPATSKTTSSVRSSVGSVGVSSSVLTEKSLKETSKKPIATSRSKSSVDDSALQKLCASMSTTTTTTSTKTTSASVGASDSRNLKVSPPSDVRRLLNMKVDFHFVHPLAKYDELKLTFFLGELLDPSHPQSFQFTPSWRRQLFVPSFILKLQQFFCY